MIICTYYSNPCHLVISCRCSPEVEQPSSKASERSDEERLSGWSTSASSTKPSELLNHWESEDAEARQELQNLQGAMSQAAGELGSGLLRLSKERLSNLSNELEEEDLPRILATSLPKLAQCCADSMQVGSEDDWATAEAGLLEALAQTSAKPEPADPDICMPDLDHSSLPQPGEVLCSGFVCAH